MTRVIAGAAGGRRLVVPSGGATRPTADRAREGLFSTLTSLRGSLDGARFLDLYAGSGAVGIEAASRGASLVVLVERDPKAVRAIRVNLAAVELAALTIRAEPVSRVLAAAPAEPFDIVFADPPYDDSINSALESLLEPGWLSGGAVVCVERASRDRPLTWPARFEAERSRRYGEAMLWYGRRS